ncbi:HlyD family type I secretion periplasmic adaptor subunit [Pontibacterium sinense]
MNKELSTDMSVYTNDMPTRMIGLIIVFLTFGVFGGWSMIAPIDSAALAPGVLTVKGYKKTVQHLEGGIIQQLYVKDGDKVEAGAPLILLDDTQLQAEHQILKGQLFVLLAQESRLLAERDELESITFPDELLSDDKRATEAKEQEAEQFLVRKISRDGEVEVLQQRIVQLNSQSEGLNALIASKKALIASYDEEISDNIDLLSQGFVDKKRLRDLQRLREGLAGEVAEHKAAIAGITIQSGEAKLKILQQKKDFRAEVVEQLSQAQAKAFDVQERVSAITDRIKRSTIMAPVSGVVLGLGFHTLGGVIAPGNKILEIVPEKNDLIIEAKVAPADIDRVTLGLDADVRFSVFKSSITPVVQGRVTTLSADRIVGEDGAPYYLAHLELTDSSSDALKGFQLLPGMPAEVLINTGDRTLFEYLVQPATDAFARSMLED